MPINNASGFRLTLLAATALAAIVAVPCVANASVVFDAVAAGDMTSSDAILWTRATDAGGAANLTAQVSTDAAFSNIVYSANAPTVANNAYTLKVDATGLTGNTQYYYRFIDGGATSQTGQFKTTPAANQAVDFKVGFSGDADGSWRPYSSIQTIASQNLNAFVFLGDTMYDSASIGSAAVPTLTPTTTNPAALQTALTAYNQKYLNNIAGVDPATGLPSASGPQGLQPLLANVGTYTLLDNHELGNKQLQSGGAPPAAAATNSNPLLDVNTATTSSGYNNGTLAYQTTLKSYLDFHPTRETFNGSPATGYTPAGPTVVAPTDVRSDGTPKQYFAQSWGKNAEYIQLDDRSYRDVRMDVLSGPRVENPARTMLGQTQLAWLEQTLLNAQAAGTPWKVISVSSPIDLQGNDSGKSWVDGYNAERNTLLKFIADNHINHVVFLTTDDHESRVSQLAYETTPGDASTYTQVSGAFQIVAGPIGAGNACSGAFGVSTPPPADCAGTTLAQINNLMLASGKTTLPGLQAGTPSDGGLNGAPIQGASFSGIEGLYNVYRQLDPTAGSNPQPLDFYSPNTFNFTTLEFKEDGTLEVKVLGIPDYLAGTFPQGTPDPQTILSFDIAVPEPASIALIGTGLLGLAALRRRRA